MDEKLLASPIEDLCILDFIYQFDSDRHVEFFKYYYLLVNLFHNKYGHIL